MLYLLCTGVINQYTITLIQHICMISQVSINYLINPGIEHDSNPGIPGLEKGSGIETPIPN